VASIHSAPVAAATPIPASDKRTKPRLDGFAHRVAWPAREVEAGVPGSIVSQRNGGLSSGPVLAGCPVQTPGSVPACSFDARYGCADRRERRPDRYQRHRRPAEQRVGQRVLLIEWCAASWTTVNIAKLTAGCTGIVTHGVALSPTAPRTSRPHAASAPGKMPDGRRREGRDRLAGIGRPVTAGRGGTGAVAASMDEDVAPLGWPYHRFPPRGTRGERDAQEDTGRESARSAWW
jgi:hypothetical protein